MNSRQLVLFALKDLETGSYTDIVVDRLLTKFELSAVDRNLFTELVNGIIRRKRTLDAIIDRLAKQPAHRQPPDLRQLLRLGLYQLRYLDRIPASAAVNTTVDLAKANGLTGLAGVVNGILRQYIRLQTERSEVLDLSTDPIERLGTLHSFPDWLVAQWFAELGELETDRLCQAFNRPPSIDLRINSLTIDPNLLASASKFDRIQAQRTKLIELFQAADIKAVPIPHVPQGLRFVGNVGAIDRLPGYREGWWTIQDSSAQLVTHLLAPQPNEIVIDACAAPGGKTTHIAELMGNTGQVLALDKTASRLKKLQQNLDRLQLSNIKVITGDSCGFSELTNTADRVLLDAPCSGLGTLHRRADARWQKTPAQIHELAQLQAQLLANTATWVKPGGVLVYATCTVCPIENEDVILPFLKTHPDWQIELPPSDSPLSGLVSEPGWIKVWLHRQQMDGFFMVKLRRHLSSNSNNS
ncbi:16S rRNA (cytosine(967)-C(5))-methyltransferase [Chamaesiphon minutus]|uniref:16S rRNA (cytosine(967)-C(5))-methyltransferase n=1 Tax=Chamaesiphon minutus (strain ATCC 27169 / PCC 6605) TaxID=1173020 RepID=K9UP71_CHAP6|nr:16S rRNA (cytosine(967)-C(5))-methyltransferase [Chamaesiphon minutus]AFY95994.1 ribosomal RNA small subunit methyltransferase RsmB [Chamaesiphon minutus PCC 6605]